MIKDEENRKVEKHKTSKVKFYIRLIGGVCLVLFLGFFFLMMSLNWLNTPVTSFILQEDWNSLQQERYNLREYWVSEDHIPNHMKWAVISSEDQLFWQHKGFDIESIQEALEERREGTRTRGASTITQQVAKNLFLTSSQSFIRKGLEAGITIILELVLSKDRILEIYLNVAEFGPGIYGIGKASDYYWGIEASQLNAIQSARLAVILPNPKRIRIEPPSEYVIGRSQWVLRQMRQLSGNNYTNSESQEIQQEQNMNLNQEQNAEDEIRIRHNDIPLDTLPEINISVDSIDDSTSSID